MMQAPDPQLDSESSSTVQSCSCCGLAQMVPAVPAGMKVCCNRCGTSLRKAGAAQRSNSRVAATALAALIVYPVAVSLPIMQIQQFGHRTQASILEGIVTLTTGGQFVVAAIVLLCSIIFPLGKLFALLAMSLAGNRLPLAHHHKAWTYRIVEWTGRWGMLDVLLVAVLVAALKLGNIMEVTPGPGAAAFAACVILSLLATAFFEPRRLWEVVR